MKMTTLINQNKKNQKNQIIRTALSILSVLFIFISHSFVYGLEIESVKKAEDSKMGLGDKKQFKPKNQKDNMAVFLTYHWHMHQPLYWPAPVPGTDRVQTAADSYDLKTRGQGFYPGSPKPHPENNLADGDIGSYDAVFSKDDRIQAYQWGPKNSIRTMLSHPNAGASISYSGSLMDNIQSWGKDGRFGYQRDWSSHNREAILMKTSGGQPRGDLVGMTYHHSLSPLLPRAVFKKELELFKESWKKYWGLGDGNYTKGFFPPEITFSETMIPLLKEMGYEWVIVANGHLARTCENYLDSDVAPNHSNSTWNTNPPNKADMTGPRVPANQWWSGSLDGRGAKVPAPYAYQAHWVQHVDPYTKEVSRIVAVPMDEVLSYMNGFSGMGTGIIDDKVAPYSRRDRPSLVLMAHDGDNAWGGGSSYYFESVPGLANEARSKGYGMTTIQQFLNDNPVPREDVVHIEDGGWVNPEGDWGDPQYVKWLYPPARSPKDPKFRQDDPRTYIDIENGFSASWRSWAVIMAGANMLETADTLANLYVTNKKADVERAWKFYLAGLDSGFMYYGDSLDDEVKQSVALNSAYPYIQDLLSMTEDRTPPTVLRPQRWPWNPGGIGWGQTTWYRDIGTNGRPAHFSDFYIWTLAYDVSGIKDIRVMLRKNLAGTMKDLSNFDSRTYAGGPTVTEWTSYPMNRRKIDPAFKGDPASPNLNLFILPKDISEHCWVKITGYYDSMLDYYIEATDAKGNQIRSDIFHVWVGARNL